MLYPVPSGEVVKVILVQSLASLSFSLSLTYPIRFRFRSDYLLSFLSPLSLSTLIPFMLCLLSFFLSLSNRKRFSLRFRLYFLNACNNRW